MSGKSRKPLIGITTYGRLAALPFSLPSEYIDAVRAAGGIPILLPPGEVEPAQVLDSLDGLIISGGGDIHPACYNGFAHPTIYSVDRERDAFELQLGKFALERHLPILGICRGLQILIVACGGTLIPHIPDVYGTSALHRLEPEPGRRLPTEHLVRIDVESLLADCLQNSQQRGRGEGSGEQEQEEQALPKSVERSETRVRSQSAPCSLTSFDISVVSWHHQAVDKVPPGWRVVAHAWDDGVIEAVEHENHPWAIGVQWHPELSILDPSHQRLFLALVQAAHTKHLSDERNPGID